MGMISYGQYCCEACYQHPSLLVCDWFLLSSPDTVQGLYCSETAAEQSASLPAARLLFCGPTGCSKRDSRACTWQSNRLQSIRWYQGHAYVAKCATIRRGEPPAALRQSRLHSISTGDNRAPIVWDKSHRECANAIGWAHLTYAQQSDIWQLVTFLPQMLKGFVSVQCMVQIQYGIPPLVGSSLSASSPLPRLQALQIPGAVSASSCAEQTFCYWSPTHQPKPGACWEICLM